MFLRSVSFLFLGLSVAGCSSGENRLDDPVRRQNQVVEYVDRTSKERLFDPEKPVLQPRPEYPWERKKI